MDGKRAANLIIRRRRAKTHLLDYLDYMRPAGLPDMHYKPASHHKVFAANLDRLLQALISQSEVDDRSATSVPPGAAKSLYHTVWWPTQLLAVNPAWKIICVSAAESLAEDFARRRRQIMLSPQWCSLAETELSPDARGIAFQGTPQGGGIYAFGSTSTIQGIRADALVGDDLVSGFEEAGNLTLLDKKWNWYTAEARPRLRRGGVEAMVATRWALLDPIGRVMRLTEKGEESWNYIRIPMICDADDDPCGRELGERLWPEYFTERMVRDAQRNPMVWNTLYQQNPAVSEHAWVPLDKVHFIPRSEMPRDLNIYIGVDIALAVAGKDFTVFAVIGVDNARNFYLLDLYRKHADPNESAVAYLSLVREHEPKACWVENDNASVMWGRIVEMEGKQMGINPRLSISKMKNRDKEVRAAHLRTLFLQDRVRIAKSDWNHTLLRELAEFPDGTNDDIVDAMGVVAKELRKITGPVLVQRVVKKPIMGAVQNVAGQIMTTQTLEELKPLNLASSGRRRI